MELKLDWKTVFNIWWDEVVSMVVQGAGQARPASEIVMNLTIE